MTPEMKQWLDSQQNLPEFMRDFHDQKDLFKAIFIQYAGSFENDLPNISWVDGHIFTVDFFLWFMAQHGYTLQKTRKKGINFFDIRTTVKVRNDQARNALSKILSRATNNH